ncbi:MFS transporter [Planococcus sp. N028]|uniref:MFS transporter n=1 Tax=Planococcus shixiaomingii TaxID=3058393 RepID=A0ABT8MZH0_9BACL|nr:MULTISPECIES: MFS transporter [unclassified Planococcus (in: firmicutes)]MDN7241005.1 MFS transporter [Planococcus sp. N028]WKA53259.1 MFS transporter [Planococcus sp. N022]
MSLHSKKSALGLMVVAIFFISLNLRPAISSIGPLLETIRSDLNLSNSEVSLLTSVPVLCMGLFAPFAVWFNRRFGIKTSITLLLSAIGLFTFFRMLVPSFAMLFFSSLFIGIAIAIIGPLVSAMIKRNFPTRTPALIGVYSFGMGLGATFAAGLTGLFYTLSNWPLALASWSLLSIIGIVLWLRVEHPKDPVQERTGEGDTAKSPWKNKRAWYMMLFFALQSALFFSMITWLAPIAIDKGMSVLTAGAVLTLMSTVQLIANIAIPILLGKYPSRFLWINVSLVIGTAGILLIQFGSLALIWPAAVLLGLTLGTLFPIALLMPLDENTTAEDVNSWTAMIQMGGYSLSAIMPFAIGLLYDRYATHTISLVMCLMLIAMMVLFAFLLNKKH